MNKHLGKSLAVLAVVIGFLIGVALTQVTGQSESFAFGPPSGTGFAHGPPSHPGHLLAKALHENVALQVLTEMTGKDTETVRADMQSKHVWEVLESYCIDGETFRSEMDAKMTELVNTAASCGLITSEQASEIVEAMQNRPQRQRGPVTGGQEG